MRDLNAQPLHVQAAKLQSSIANRERRRADDQERHANREVGGGLEGGMRKHARERIS